MKIIICIFWIVWCFFFAVNDIMDLVNGVGTPLVNAICCVGLILIMSIWAARLVNWIDKKD